MSKPSAVPGDRPDSARPRPRRYSLLRAFVPADFITLANSACGILSVLFCIRYAATNDTRFAWFAAGLLPLAFVLDALDGFVARSTGRSSAYGGDLDSLADIVSFGVAPAALGYVLGMNGAWDMAILTYFIACGTGRLARFNVTKDAMTTEKNKVSHFEGTPIPTSLVVVAVLAFALGSGRTQDALPLGTIQLGGELHPLALLFALSGTLMVTARLRIPKP